MLTDVERELILLDAVQKSYDAAAFHNTALPTRQETDKILSHIMRTCQLALKSLDHNRDVRYHAPQPTAPTNPATLQAMGIL